ncbi:MAG: AAA family ATPase [Methanomassiliicoccales archaeon]|nr:AAA family ATPase [Methanomassiliicoccales archaeon]
MEKFAAKVIICRVGMITLGQFVDMKPPLIGRDSELEQLMASLSDALSGTGGLVILAGEAGVGKTRLAEEFARYAANAGCEILTGRCVPGALLPYLPFQQAFACYSSTSRNLDGIFGKMSIDLSTTSRSQRVLLSCLDFLSERTEQEPVVLRLEDLQWADSKSIELMHFLARSCVRLRVMVLGTVRSDELAPNPSGTPHPLTESLRAMQREGIYKQINLPPLDANDIGNAVRAMLGSPVDPDLLSDIAKETAGNPLFMVELVRMLLAKEAIILHEGLWTRDANGPIAIPSNVSEVILHRLGLVDREKRRILECASVVGETFKPELVAQILRKSSPDLFEELGSLSDQHQLLRETESGYSFSHEKVRRVVYEGISHQRRREMHQMVAEIIESMPIHETSYAALAYHFGLADIPGKFVSNSLAAGDVALRFYAFKEAEEHFRGALSKMKDIEPPELRRRALIGQGMAAKELGEFERAIHSFEKALPIAKDDAEKANILILESRCWGPTCFGKGSTVRSKGLLDEAEATPDLDIKDLIQIKMVRSSLLKFEGQIEKAHRLLLDAEGMLEEIGDDRMLAESYTLHRSLYLSMGKMDKALEVILKAKSIFEEVDDPSGLSQTLFDLGVLQWHEGSYEEALEAYRRSDAIAKRLGDPNRLCWNHVYVSLLYQSTQDYDRMEEEAHVAEKYLRMFDSIYLSMAVNGLLMDAAIHNHDLKLATEFCDRLRAQMKSCSWTTNTPTRGMVYGYQGKLFAKRGLLEASDRVFKRALEMLEGTVLSMLTRALLYNWWGEAQEETGRYYEARDKFERAIELYSALGNERQVRRLNAMIADL